MILSTQKDQILEKSKAFFQASEKLTQRKYYHGTPLEILDDHILPRKNFNSTQSGVVCGAFVTSDEAFAKFFAIHNCIGIGHTTLTPDNKIYLERLSNNIIPEFYVYIVYETPDNKFIQDNEKEYYSTKPIKIAHRKKFDTAKEIEKLGYEIYVLTEPLKNKTNMNASDNFAVQKEMQERINHKRFHRVDIASIIKKQSEKRFQTMAQKSQFISSM